MISPRACGRDGVAFESDGATDDFENNGAVAGVGDSGGAANEFAKREDRNEFDAFAFLGVALSTVDAVGFAVNVGR